MSSVEPTPAYLRPYRDAVDVVGPAFESLLWRSPEMQRTRLEVVTGMIDLDGRTVCDLGCGRADLAALWEETGAPYGGYVGVDGVPELVGACRDRAQAAGWTRCSFVEADFVADTDLVPRLVREKGVSAVAISGSLNTLQQSDAERVLGRAWDALARTPGAILAFNFLSDRAHTSRRRGENLGPANRFDTHRLLGWALDRSPNVRFRQDYLGGHDATIAMVAEGSRR